MQPEAPKTVFLKDYTVPEFLIEMVELTFSLDEEQTLVKSRLEMVRNPKYKAEPGELALVGEELKFVKAYLNGRELQPSQFEVTPEAFILKRPADQFVLEIENCINPSTNTSLDGLYFAANMFCSQNEPEGFRRITYYLDRPDVMSRFSTKIIANKSKYPVLLSNGNLIEQGDLDNGQHFAKWHDPFPKPCYLYALVAGDLELVRDEFVSKSGRKIDLHIYCDKGNGSKCQHAMTSLKKSMKWDEERFGLEYDLDIFMIVAVDAFNMGAMENKGLNIFNSVYVLADQASATDENFLGIESVIAHEYFHNWTGNRVTCRDWFQLTLKEGLTVYRDQEFSSDLNSRAVQRIADVHRLKSAQFPEDSGPTSHPIRPESYIEINNFYTPTVYEKGAEVIRMVETMLGRDGFRRGMDKYFELFDGQAVTTEDFIHAMSSANAAFDFSKFKRWYHQAGTPRVEVKTHFEQKSGEFSLTVSQHCSATSGQAEKLPYHFPIRLGLVDGAGKDMTLKLKNSAGQQDLNRGILHIMNERETFIFESVKEKPYLSFNRGFSAPVHVETDLSHDDYYFLIAHDSDSFNRYEAFQMMASKEILKAYSDLLQSNPVKLSTDFLQAFLKVLGDKNLDAYFKAFILALPEEELLHQEVNPVHIVEMNHARHEVESALMRLSGERMLELYNELKNSKDFSIEFQEIGKRALKNRLLGYLVNATEGEKLCLKQFEQATNMTDELGALKNILSFSSDSADICSQKFYNKWKQNSLVMQKWFATWSAADRPDIIERLKKLEGDDAFNIKIPNYVRSLYGGFTRNYKAFHHSSGEGHALLADKIIVVDGINPQMASGLAKGFKLYRKLPENLKASIETQLRRILAHPGLSKNTYEIVSKTLEG